MINLAALDERIEKCEKILDENPESQIFAALADARRKKGELDKAFRICRQGIRRHPDYGPGHLVMAKINFDRKMYDWADAELSEAIRLDGRTRATDLLQAEIYVRQQRFDKAKTLADELFKSDPQNEYYKELRALIEEGKQEHLKKQMMLKRMYNSQTEEHIEEEVEKAQKREEADKPLGMPEVLEQISAFPDIIACFFTDRKGMMIESSLPESFDKNSYAALSAEIYRFANENVGTIEYGKVRQVLIELANEKVWIFRQGEEILVLVLAAKANLGSLKLKISNTISRMA